MQLTPLDEAADLGHHLGVAVAEIAERADAGSEVVLPRAGRGVGLAGDRRRSGVRRRLGRQLLLVRRRHRSTELDLRRE